MRHKREWSYEVLCELRHERHEAKEQLRNILGERETETLFQTTKEERRHEEWN